MILDKIENNIYKQVEKENEIYRNNLNKEKSAILNQNNELKITLLKILCQIQMFEQMEEKRVNEEYVNYKIINNRKFLIN